MIPHHTFVRKAVCFPFTNRDIQDVKMKLNGFGKFEVLSF
jgi:hypothetical protein